MKQTLLLITFAIGMSCSAWAAACPTGEKLSDYIALSPAGCTIGDITFSDFGYTASGSILIPATDVAVTPQMVGGESGFRFNAPWLALPNGSLLDAAITYKATCDLDCQIDDWILKIGGANAPGDSAINVSESAEELSDTLGVGALGGHSTTVASGTFAPVDSLTLTKDILVYGGTQVPGGLFAQVSSVTNLFSTTNMTTMTPEPSLVLLCAGGLGLLPVMRRKMRRA